MLSKEALIELFDRLGTPTKGRELVTHARTHAPVRQVKSRGSNVITVMNSLKMGCEIRTESRHVEFAAAVDKEYDPAVLEYYAQPCEEHIELVDPQTGEIHRISHTPDFLVIGEDGIFLEEWKTEDKLIELASRYPYRYQSTSTGQWYAPLIESHFAKLGIGYRVCSQKAIPQKRIENYLHLADYFHPAAPACPDETLARVQALLREHGALTIAELQAQPFSFAADELNKAIADKLVVVDLDREALTQPRRARLYRDETYRDFLAADPKHQKQPGYEDFVVDIAEGAQYLYDGEELTVSLLGEQRIVFSKKSGGTIELERAWLLNAIEEKRVQPVGDVGAFLWS